MLGKYTAQSLRQQLWVLLLTISPLLLVACHTSPKDDEEIPDGMRALVVQVAVDNAARLRSTTVEEPGNKYLDLNENKVDNVELFLFDKESNNLLLSTLSGGKVTLKRSETESLKFVLLIPFAESKILENRALRLVAVANASETIVKPDTYGDLQKQIVNAGDFNKVSQKQSTLLMDGEVEINAFRWDNQIKRTLLDQLKLRRATAKVRLRISAIEVKETKDGTTEEYEVVGTPAARIIHYTSKGSLLAGAPYAVKEEEWQDSPYVDLEDRIYPDFVNLHKPNTADQHAFLTTPIPFYSYENDWSKDHDDETYMLLRIPLRSKRLGEKGEIKNYYYRIPINYRMGSAQVSEDELFQLKRNYLYDVEVYVARLGSEDEGEPMTIDSNIAIQPWLLPDEIDGSLKAAHYLVVEELTPQMPNLKERTIEYQSDLPVEVKIVKTRYQYYDSQGKLNVIEKVNTSEEFSTSTTFDHVTKYTPKGQSEKQIISKISLKVDDLGHQKVLKIEHDIPTNYVPLEITFKVQQKSRIEGSAVLDETVVVTQFPPKYVTGEKSPGFRGGTSDPAGADFRFHDPFGVMAVDNSNASTDHSRRPQICDVFFKVTTIVPVAGERIGDPAYGGEKTSRTSEANELVSPEFIVASQHGMSVPIPQYQDVGYVGWKQSDFGSGYGPNALSEEGVYRHMYPQMSYKGYRNAEERCYNYFEGEYGMDGTYTEYYYGINGSSHWGQGYYLSRQVRKTFKYKGRWRVPTEAELRYINQIQRDERSAVKSLLWGRSYWTARDGYVFDLSGHKSVFVSDLNPIRCVFDTYKLKKK